MCDKENSRLHWKHNEQWLSWWLQCRKTPTTNIQTSDPNVSLQKIYTIWFFQFQSIHILISFNFNQKHTLFFTYNVCHFLSRKTDDILYEVQSVILLLFVGIFACIYDLSTFLSVQFRALLRISIRCSWTHFINFNPEAQTEKGHHRYLDIWRRRV